MDIKTIDKENAQIIIQRYLNIPLTGFDRITKLTPVAIDASNL